MSDKSSLWLIVSKGAPLMFVRIVSTLQVKYLAESSAVWSQVVDYDGLSNKFIFHHNDLESEQLFIEFDQNFE